MTSWWWRNNSVYITDTMATEVLFILMTNPRTFLMCKCLKCHYTFLFWIKTSHCNIFTHPKVIIVQKSLFRCKPTICMVSLLSEQLQLLCLCQVFSVFFPCHAQRSPQLFQVCQTWCWVLLNTSYWKMHPRMLQGRLLLTINLGLIKMLL